MNSQFTVVIPARYGSSRLPGKPLALIGARPMIAWVYERARRSGAEEVLIATDDMRIVAAGRAIGARVELTDAAHASGTDRIAELARRFGWSDERIIVNVQGDEPLIPPLLIAQVAELLDRHPDASVGTLVTPIGTVEEYHDKAIVKVILDRTGYALYFSRAPIPCLRDDDRGMPHAWRHVGLYAYRAGALKAIAAAPPCELEQIERLEQLRALWLGQRIVAEAARAAVPPAVDTEADLLTVRDLVARMAGPGTTE